MSSRVVSEEGVRRQATASVGSVRDVLALADAHELVLAAPQAARRVRLRRAEDRTSFLAARVLARRLLHEVSGSVLAEISQTCSECRGHDHGRPLVHGVPEWQVSWARRDAAVAVAVATGPVGIDLEPLDAVLPTSLRTHAPRLHDLLGWTRAEALVKVGAASLDDWSSGLPSGPPAPAGRRLAAGGWLLTDRVATGWVASVASRDPVEWTATAPL